MSKGEKKKKGIRKEKAKAEEDVLKGYKGYAREKLEATGAKIWDIVEIEKDERIVRGIILPRSEFEEDTTHINLKLKSGYNVGIELTDSMKITIQGYEAGEYHFPEKEIIFNENLPKISLLGTGGTISSRLDYRTGAVHPAITPAELFTTIPELAELCNLYPEIIFNIVSEDMDPAHWVELAKVIANKIEVEQADGVVIAHGTDTLCVTGAALSFLLQELPVPIILVGSQRSSDRPSSDSAMNLINAVRFAAQANVAEVLICMSGSTSHDFGLLHRPGRARKMHSSRRDAFKTIGTIPFGKIQKTDIIILEKTYQKRDKTRKLKATLKMDPKVALLYHFPGIQPDLIDTLIDKEYHGLVLAGTGLGHISKNLLDPLKRAIEANIAVVMTLQTLWGFTGMQVYQRGREELAIGIIPGHGLLPETAYAKLSWILGQTRNLDEVRLLMLKNIAGEIPSRETIAGYLILQGIEPGLENYYKALK